MGNQPPAVRGSNCEDLNTQVYSYAVNHTTGTLAQESTIALSGFCANAAAIDPLGRFLYVGEVDATASQWQKVGQKRKAGNLDRAKIGVASGTYEIVGVPPI